MGLVQRQSDDVAVGAADPGNEGSRSTLDGIAASLAQPSTADEIGGPSAVAQSLENNLRDNNPNDRLPARRYDAKAADDTVASARKEHETRFGAVVRLGLREYPTATGYDRVGA